MFSNEVLQVIESHEKEIEMIQQKLYQLQMALNEAYQRQWAKINELIREGLWDEEAVYPGNCYGLKIDHESYVFQLDTHLPFLPNSYYRNFKKSYKEFYAIKLMLSLQLRDVIEQMGDKPLSQPATLYIVHYYRNVRIFDLDNKAKQVIINTLRRSLLRGDTVEHLAGYREDAIYNTSEEGSSNRTMIYLYPYQNRRYFENEVISNYPRIDHLEGVIKGKICKTLTWKVPPNYSITQHTQADKLDQKPRNINEQNMGNFM